MRGNSDSPENMSVSVDGGPNSDLKQWKDENSQTLLQRTYMNNLVMNYLVTGEHLNISYVTTNKMF